MIRNSVTEPSIDLSVQKNVLGTQFDFNVMIDIIDCVSKDLDQSRLQMSESWTAVEQAKLCM